MHVIDTECIFSVTCIFQLFWREEIHGELLNEESQAFLSLDGSVLCNNAKIQYIYEVLDLVDTVIKFCTV